MTKNEILNINEPFSFTELKNKSVLIKKNDLDELVEEGKLRNKKIGRINIYWKVVSEPTPKSGLESYTKQLELEITELKHELMEEKEKVRQLSIQDGIDDPWKEVAMEMARILSEQKQISLQEVLEYFNAPLTDY